jgi:hypothetical protein
MPPLYLRKGSFFVQKMGSTTPIGSSHGDFGLVVHALDHAAGKLFSGLEIVQQ